MEKKYKLKKNIIEIYTIDDLNEIRRNLDSVFILMNDLNLSHISNWSPIGNQYLGFKGCLIGNNYTISGLNIDSLNTKRLKHSHTGFFAKMLPGSLVENLNIDHINVEGNSYCGGLVGQNSGGVIKSVEIKGNIKSVKDHCGGLIGANSKGYIIKSNFTGNIRSDANNVGGIVGKNCAYLEKCNFNGSILGKEKVGGLIGYNNHGVVVKSTSNGDITGKKYKGGLIGYNTYGKSINSVSFIKGDCYGLDFHTFILNS